MCTALAYHFSIFASIVFGGFSHSLNRWWAPLVKCTRCARCTVYTKVKTIRPADTRYAAAAFSVFHVSWPCSVFNKTKRSTSLSLARALLFSYYILLMIIVLHKLLLYIFFSVGALSRLLPLASCLSARFAVSDVLAIQVAWPIN